MYYIRNILFSLCCFLAICNYCNAHDKFIRTDIQHIYYDNNRILVAIFNKNPLVLNSDKTYFYYSRVNNTLYIYNNNMSISSPVFSLKLDNVNGDSLNIKQFINLTDNKVFYSVYTPANYLLEGHCYLIGEYNNNFKLYINTKNYATVLNKKFFIPVFLIENDGLLLDFIQLIGKHSKRYRYELKYNNTFDRFDTIDKGLTTFDFDEYKRTHP